MARKQAQRRKQRKAQRWRLPSIPFARIARFILALAVVILSYRFSAALLDQPIESITIDGPFQRVSALQIEEAIGSELDEGFLSANLSEVQVRIVSLPWIDRASVSRRWPGKLKIRVSEQVPAACWGERGLMNIRGELFVNNARHIPAELPRLSGPEGRSSDVAKMYLEVQERLIPLGLNLRSVNLDARGAWQLTLQDGVDIRLGRRDIDERTDLFVVVVANIVSSREADIEFVDMRYNNGFTIGWKENVDPAKPQESSGSRQQMVAGRAE
jgi:cell division protein FtsQ